MTEERASNNRFKEFAHMFENMTVETKFQTLKKCIVNIVITFCGKNIIALVKADDTKYQIMIYNAHD